MSDIVERLEKWGTGSPELILMLREASREIVKLRCEVAYWREPDDSATTIATLRKALELAGNRLARAALNAPFNSCERFELQEWADEARTALQGNSTEKEKP